MPDLLKYPHTDIGNGERLVAMFGGKCRYCHDFRSWLIYNGKRWIRDRNGRMNRNAKETIRTLYLQATKITSDKARQQIEGFARRSESVKSIRAMLECARSERDISVSAEDLDQNPLLLNCQNGTVDLETGDLREHRPDDLITKICNVEFDPRATCEVFDAFIARILGDDLEMILYLQQVIGYSLTGLVSEKALFCLFGDGNNGKTTLLESLRYVLNDYSGQIMIESLLKSESSNNSNALADLSDLKGARFVTTSEAEHGAVLSEAQIKQITGMGQLKSCRKYENPVVFPPTHKLFMDSNHRPRVKGRDAAIWNRLKLIPFNVTIPEPEIDKGLLGKLKKDEAPGILRWAVAGCLYWRAFGLEEPEQVSNSVTEWRADSEPYKDFFSACCEFDPAASCKSAELISALDDYSKAAGVKIDKQDFYKELDRRGCSPTRTKESRLWRGIRVRRGDGVTPGDSAFKEIIQ